MLEDFVIARNTEPGSTLPHLLRIPLGDGIVLKAKDTWPRTGKVYCHRVDEWPTDAEIIERVPMRSCVRRGAAIDLVLDRGRENRSQIVITNARGRQMIFWQTARTSKQARPAVSLPGARASRVADLEIAIDHRERYPFTFADRQATTRREPLSAGDYGLIVDGLLQATVERKSLADLVTSLTTGKLKFQLTELAAIPRAAVVVEERYSQVFKLDHVRPSVVADGIAECQIRFPTVPIVFCETRKLAQEWTYRFLAAAKVGLAEEMVGDLALRSLKAAPALAPAPPTPADVRRWAARADIVVSDRGRIPAAVMDQYLEARARGEI
ncbi:MAG: Lsr2 family protein [Nocardioidaceae bacterium]|nr:Lsr2 family protein [Nocardioidaceae bacterium]MCL2611812.1 Lsr2 family protein [Nocardioidaceae bacterium]